MATGIDDNTAQLWDVSDLYHPHFLAMLPGHIDTVWSVVFSPDGHTLITSSADGTVWLWDVGDLHRPRRLSPIVGHTGTVYSVALSSDRHTLATASADFTARLWETDVDRAADRICRTTPAITASEWHQYLPDLPYQPPCRRAA